HGAGAGNVKSIFFVSSQEASYTGATPHPTILLHTPRHVPQQPTTLVLADLLVREIESDPKSETPRETHLRSLQPSALCSSHLGWQETLNLRAATSHFDPAYLSIHENEGSLSA